jgi:xanthine/uracil permease
LFSSFAVLIAGIVAVILNLVIPEEVEQTGNEVQVVVHDAEHGDSEHEKGS